MCVALYLIANCATKYITLSIYSNDKCLNANLVTVDISTKNYF